jgi:hypothetical protein
VRPSPLRRVAYALVPVAALLGGAEVAARLLWDPTAGVESIDAGVQMVGHPTRIWGLQPDSAVNNFGVSVEVDADGLRVGAEGPPGPTWMVVGDSSFFGHGLEHADTLHVALRDQLAAVGHPATVLCGAVPGYSVLQTRRLLDEVGWAREPDLLVVGNLWSDNNFDYFVDADWLAELDRRMGRGAGVAARSQALSWAMATLRPPDVTLRGDPQGRIRWIREPHETGRRRVPIGRYQAELDSLLGDAAARGVGVVVVQPANRYRVSQVGGAGADTPYTWDPYFVAQRQVAERRGVPVVDAAAALRVFGLAGDAAFLDEMHPTGPANQAIAMAIVTGALEAGWPGASLVPAADPGPIAPPPADVWQESGRFMVNAGQDAAPPAP